MTESSVEKVATKGKGCEVTIKTKKGEENISCDIVLSAVGIEANIQNIGLEEVGIVVDKGKIIVNEFYDKEQFYWWHRDARRYPYYDNDFPNLIRKLSVTVSLSHPEEYEGGYLQMAARREWSDTHLCQVTEILPRGSICVFPSYTWHRVSPVTKGRRLSLVQWNLGEGYV